MSIVMNQFTEDSRATEEAFDKVVVLDEVVLGKVVFDEVVLDKFIGDGTTSVVYKAIDKNRGPVAVKKFRPRFAFHAKREIEMLQRVQGHPNFTQIFAVWNDGETNCISMELLDGDLLSMIEAGMSIEEVYKATTDIISALEHLHSVGLVHFDLKPENIGYKDGVFKILDLGSAYTKEEIQMKTFQEELNSGTTLLTTVQYRPFEAFQQEGQQHNEKTDVWSLGCIVYEMLTGDQLFDTHDSLSRRENLDEITIGLEKIESECPIKNKIFLMIKQSLNQCVAMRPTAGDLKFLVEY